MSTHLTQADEDASHGLEVERLVAVEDEDELAELVAERLDRLGLAGAGGAEGRAAQARRPGTRSRSGTWRSPSRSTAASPRSSPSSFDNKEN